MNELDIISKTLDRLPSFHEMPVGPGDDCAQIVVENGLALVTSDMLLDGKHFDSKLHTLEEIINKVLGVNCSDIYAMGGLPTFASITIAFPNLNTNRGAFPDAVAKACNKYKVTLSGGDTNTWDGPLAVSLTLYGTAIKEPILRSGAKKGDLIFVTGKLGGSLASSRHLDPPNKRDAVVKLLDNLEISSMIDISDGLATDLRHILKASKVGAIIDSYSVPIHEDASSLDEALCDGEDFELCFTVDQKNADLIEKLGLDKSLGLYRIGKTTPNKNLLQLQTDSRLIEYQNVGFEHQ
ncbi:thiamine-phosphate kinase [bacterium]|nr:thiamine-phosphate kinase [bacterium]